MDNFPTGIKNMFPFLSRFLDKKSFLFRFFETPLECDYAKIFSLDQSCENLNNKLKIYIKYLLNPKFMPFLLNRNVIKMIYQPIATS